MTKQDPPPPDPLLLALDARIRTVVDAAVEQRLASLMDWVDQARSPLGRKAHLALAKTGKVKASKLGKQVLIWRADLNAYIARHPVKVTAPANDTEQVDEVAEMRALLDASGIRK